jgi:hypothetical protein
VRTPLLSLTLPLLVTTGCVRQATQDFEMLADRTAEESPRPGEEQEVIVAYDGPVEGAAEPATSTAVPLRERHLQSEPVLFRLGAGYGALGHLDLAPCREQGLPPGYVHMRVTFRHSGRVVHAAVESAAPPPREALACIGERLEVAIVPVFEGGDVTLSRSFFVN